MSQYKACKRFIKRHARQQFHKVEEFCLPRIRFLDPLSRVFLSSFCHCSEVYLGFLVESPKWNKCLAREMGLVKAQAMALALAKDLAEDQVEDQVMDLVADLAEGLAADLVVVQAVDLVVEKGQLNHSLPHQLQTYHKHIFYSRL